ncbi:hypothetical protein RFI_26557 [Reticulomyxa filosa]|uniref:RNA helicase n=1 Tax=Reticulomyxa filosa TaxID=46433 RepID=X6MBI2_RETFI|nr:hypothetical protein RFI_26557 [Reticulomyxa filosa]|eukprot:ETO10822.1 hypothetical protein RFI_26557 [Reticulomyxa filosa]
MIVLKFLWRALMTEQTKPKSIKGSYATLADATFKDMLLNPELNRALGDAGFEHPSEVQNEAIPKALLGQDMIVQAKVTMNFFFLRIGSCGGCKKKKVIPRKSETFFSLLFFSPPYFFFKKKKKNFSGMGKTAVFVLAALNQITPETGVVDTLVICHTREMAFQVAGEFERFSKYMPGVITGVVYGGVPFPESKRVIAEEKPHILIGTPGRLVHLLEDGVLKLDKLKRFVVDECDNLLKELDMRKQVQHIFRQTPHNKQVMMFSATIDETARAVCRKFTKSPKEIFVDDKQLTLHGLQQHYVKLQEKDKNRKLNDLLDALDFNQVVIFVKSQLRAEQLNHLLAHCSFPSIFVHGKMKQEKRLEYFKAFKEYKHRILVATNLFGRGVDIEKVNIGMLI